MERSDRTKKAIRMLVLATLFWGISFPVMRMLGLLQVQLLPESSSWFGTSVAVMGRFGGAALLILVWSWPTLRQITRKELWLGLGLGVSGGLGILFQMDGLVYTNASTSAFLTQAYCLIIPFVSAITHRRWPRPMVLFCTLLLLMGAAILTRVNLQDFHLGRGETETLIGAFIFTFQIMLLERPEFREGNVKHFSLVMFAVMTALALPVTVMTSKSMHDVVVIFSDLRAAALLFVLITVCTLFAYVMMNHWQPHVSAVDAAIIYGVEPVFASVFALFLPSMLSRWTQIPYANEVLDLHLLAGGGLIVLANVLVHIKPKS